MTPPKPKEEVATAMWRGEPLRFVFTRDVNACTCCGAGGRGRLVVTDEQAGLEFTLTGAAAESFWDFVRIREIPTLPSPLIDIPPRRPGGLFG